MKSSDEVPLIVQTNKKLYTFPREKKKTDEICQHSRLHRHNLREFPLRRAYAKVLSVSTLLKSVEHDRQSV